MGVHDDDYPRIKGAAISEMRQCGYGYLAEDFFQYCCMKKHETKKWKQTYRQMAVDFLRDYFGTDNENRRMPRKEFVTLHKRLPSGDVEDLTDLYQSKSLFARYHEPVRQVYDDYHKFLETGVETAIFVLYHLWDFNEEEVGVVLGVSASRVSQRLKRVNDKLQAAINGKHPKIRTYKKWKEDI